jgi:signal transduction histidine kinase
MEVIVVGVVGGVVGLALGLFLGRGAGRAAGYKEGHARGLQDGHSAGKEAGRSGFLAEGRASGVTEGQTRGLEEGRTRGRAEGREEGVAEGLARGRDEGYARGLKEGRDKALTETRAEAETRFRSVVEAVRRGRLPDAGTQDGVEADLRAALAEGWAPREAERQAALREAVGRVSAFLKANVRGPLSEADENADADELRERMDRAVGALQDLDFFITEVDEARQGEDLGRLAQSVSRDFAADHDVTVRMMLGSTPARADVNAAAFMDALYLVLHNAGRFGGGGTVDLTVQTIDGRATVTVRDRGEGFSEEAFARAFDPFYSTSDEGLGLGLPHVRKVVEGMGGRIELRNVPDGGAAVEISFIAS